MHLFFLTFPAHATFVAYLAAFIGMIVEGEVVLFTSLYLGTIGYFNFSYLGFVLVLGIFTGDFLWYRLGIFVANHPSLEWVDRRIEKLARVIDEQLDARPIHTLFISKFTYGLNRIALLRAGARKVPLITFLEADIMAVVAWLLIIGGISFGLSRSLAEAKKYIKYVEVGFVIGILAFIIITHIVSRISYANVEKTGKKVHAKNERDRAVPGE